MTAETLAAGAGTDSGLWAGHELTSAIFVLPFITLLGFLIPILYIFPPVPATKSDALSETHIRLGLRKAESNLKDQYAPRHKGDAAASEIPKAKVQALTVYPVKSCRGIEVSRSRVLPTGLEFDRLYTFAQLKSPFPLPVNATDEEKQKGHTWNFITQRQFSLLAMVKVDVWVPNPARKHATGGYEGTPDETWIVMRFPWKAPGLRGVLQTVAAKLSRGWSAVAEKEILLPAAFPSVSEIKQRGYEFEKVKIWKEVVEALNMKAELPKELAQYLGVSNQLGLFRIDPRGLRDVFRCAPTKENAGYQPIVGFQDAYPLHLMSLASLQEFNSVVPKDETLKQLDVRRFRSNIIVSGPPPYDEEVWKSIRLTPGKSTLTNSAEFQISCRTVRCKLPNVDPSNGVRHRVEPDRSLRKLRNVDEGSPLNGCLGMQLCPLFEDAEDTDPAELRSWIEVGMDVEVTQRGKHTYIDQ